MRIFNLNSKYTAKARLIKLELLKYNALNLLQLIVSYVYTDYSGEKTASKHPWALMLLIKWIFTYHDFDDNKNKISRWQFTKLIKQTYKASFDFHLPDKEPELFLFLRATAYQQFWWHRGPDRARLARQFLLFDNNYFQLRFKEKHDLELSSFLVMSSVLISLVYDKPNPNIFRDDLKRILKVCSDDTSIDLFINCISSSINDLRKMYYEDKNKHYPAEPYQLSKLLRKPILEYENSLIIWHPSLLYKSLEDFVFMSLREDDPQKFMKKFGMSVENYISNSLFKTGLKIINENMLKSIIGDNEECCDFLISDSDSLIFLESKSAIIKENSQISLTSKTVREKLKETVEKAIKQAHSVFQNKNQFHKLGITGPYNPPFLLVVTYFDHYILSGKSYDRCFSNTVLTDLVNEYDEVIPIENIYIINIEEFDCLCAAIKNGNTTLVAAIEDAKEKDKFAHTESFCFMQHLERLGINDAPEWLIDVSKNQLSKSFNNQR